MLPFLQLHALAATRGDRLRPELRVSLERLAEVSQAASNVAVGMMDVIDFFPRWRLTEIPLQSATRSADRPTARLLC